MQKRGIAISTHTHNPIHTHTYDIRTHNYTDRASHSIVVIHTSHILAHEAAPAHAQPVFIHTLQTNTGTNTQT